MPKNMCLYNWFMNLTSKSSANDFLANNTVLFEQGQSTSLSNIRNLSMDQIINQANQFYI